MKEISLNILDVAQNSLRANATEINILVFFDTAADRLTVSIKDNGCGMSQEFVSRVLDPFTTTRTTRRVGPPLFRQSALEAGGDFSIESREGKGTEVSAWFRTSHIDRMPLGDLAGTVTTLLNANDSVRYILVYRVDDREFVFDTEQAKKILQDVPLSAPEVAAFLEDYIKQGINSTNGGNEIL
ncbi:MAG: ATP-binding protein [Lachnospiraceae bacterium]